MRRAFTSKPGDLSPTHKMALQKVMNQILREAGAREIHRDVDDLGNSRILYHIDMPDAPPIARAHVICSSTGKNHFLKVRPEYDTVDAAVAATFGLTPESYQMVWQA